MALKSQKMNLDYIRTFVILGQSRNMTEASKKLEVTISYVSRHMKQLEEELQTKLIIPSPKNQNLILTEAGKYFFEKYEKIYNEILLTEKEYKQREKIDDCKITIGITNDLETLILKPKILKFTKKYPNICIKIINGNTQSLANTLTQYSIDFMITKEDPIFFTKTLEFETHEILSSNYCFAYNPKFIHSDINHSTLILPIGDTPERTIVNNYIKKRKISPKASFEVQSYEQMVSYILDGLGIGFVLKESIKNYKQLEIINIDCKNKILISYNKEKLTPAAIELLKLFKIKF